jgi:hypothetical protein
VADRRGTIEPPASVEAGGLHAAPRRSRWPLALILLVVLLIAIFLVVVRPWDGGRKPSPTPPSQPHQVVHDAPLDAHGRPYRAFGDRSWWNTPVPVSAPQNPHATQILDYLSTAPESGHGCLRLAGAENNKWGQPAYWAQPSDPEYAVHGLPAGAPPEMQHLRIPVGAGGANNSDGTMTVYDVARGYVALMTDAHYDAATDTWSASGATVTYLDSNGLLDAIGKSNDPRNIGTHRGNNGATSYVRYDMVKAGAVRNVLKIAAGPELSNRWVFPMTGSDGDVTDPAVGAPPEGLRLRLKPSIDLSQLGLHPQALVIARALQTYGVYIGDSGGTTALKLEDTKTEGRGQQWTVTADDLCMLPFTAEFWDVLPGGYDPSAH